MPSLPQVSGFGREGEMLLFLLSPESLIIPNPTHTRWGFWYILVGMSIALTEEQEKERLTQKSKEFNEGIAELEKKTGMTVVAVLQPSRTKLEATLLIVPIPDGKPL